MRRENDKNRIKLKGLIVRTALLVILVCSWMILTAGTFSGAVKLKNAGRPFVDLDSVIVTGDTGKGGNAGIDIDEDDTSEGTAEDYDKEVEIVIEVKEEKIKLGEEYVSYSEFESDFSREYGSLYADGAGIILADDYAEYHTYKKVKEYLDKKNYKYDEERR